jgi:hypothetical protein
LSSTWEPQTITLDQAATTRHLRLTAHSGFGKDTSTALADIAVLYAGPPMPENTGADEIRYQRSRSTSTDVDEGQSPADPPPNQPAKPIP